MRKIAALITTILLGLPTVSVAQNSPVVVELFTSQGCSSCPPADAYLTTLADREDVVALALHVDYWDYIGWKDKFADPPYTKRQKAYAQAAGHRSIYTPQIIVNGKEHVVGNHPKDVAQLISTHNDAAAVVDLSISKDGQTLAIAATASQEIKGPIAVQLVRYEPSQSVKIRSGENAGKEITYSNIVTEWHHIANWNSRKPLQMVTEVTGDQPVVVILQRKGPGQIVATARLR